MRLAVGLGSLGKGQVVCCIWSRQAPTAQPGKPSRCPGAADIKQQLPSARLWFVGRDQQQRLARQDKLRLALMFLLHCEQLRR